MGKGPVAIMKYQSTRFGEFEVTDNEILNCPDGLYGFEQDTQFALLSSKAPPGSMPRLVIPPRLVQRNALSPEAVLP